MFPKSEESQWRSKLLSGFLCKVFIKWASLIEINWIKIGLIK